MLFFLPLFANAKESLVVDYYTLARYEEKQVKTYVEHWRLSVNDKCSVFAQVEGDKELFEGSSFQYAIYKEKAGIDMLLYKGNIGDFLFYYSEPLPQMDWQMDESDSRLKEEVDKYIADVDLEAVEKAADIIMDAESKGNRVHVTGIGKPGHVAGYVASLLSSTGTPTYELHGTEAVHGSSGQVLPGDVVIAISNSGETTELQATVNTLLVNGAHIISCTGNDQSTLAKASEVCLKAHVDKEGDSLNKPPRASIIAEIIVLQTLSDVLEERKKLTLNQYVKWHPGGSLGKSIREMQK